MKKRVAVRCAAANDSDDDFDSHELSKRQRIGSSVEAAAPAHEGSQKVQRPHKEKEFAWMDSEEEGDDAEDNDQEDARSEDGTLDVSVAELDAASSFGQLLRLVPSLHTRMKADQMEVIEVAAVYRALARVKFFDGDVLETLNETLCGFCREGKLTDSQLASDVILGLAALNAYDRKVFSAIAKAFRSCVVDADTRKRWCQVFHQVNHKHDQDFVQTLEAAPLLPNDLRYKRIRCQHDARGSCALGAQCTYSHDPRAPPALIQEEPKKATAVMLTACQLYQGHGAYATSRKL